MERAESGATTTRVEDGRGEAEYLEEEEEEE